MTGSPTAHQRPCSTPPPPHVGPCGRSGGARRHLPQQSTSSAVRNTTAQKVDDILGQRLASLRLANLDTEAIEQAERTSFFDEANEKCKSHNPARSVTTISACNPARDMSRWKQLIEKHRLESWLVGLPVRKRKGHIFIRNPSRERTQWISVRQQGAGGAELTLKVFNHRYRSVVKAPLTCSSFVESL
ncbi:hypothetical protein Q5P01_003464 [Channa striata]|uniref:Uncharacterized protein n=1 Tax=Channa striata TaxID=64152 RepID=A0AA88NFY7_CHASR|nr:hypothetical protein Q5P01_003464 [Channa striata]